MLEGCDYLDLLNDMTVEFRQFVAGTQSSLWTAAPTVWMSNFSI